MFASLGKALIEARDQQREPWESIEAVLSWEALCSMIDTIETLSQPRRLDALGYVDAFYPQIRRYAPAMLEELDFQAAAGGEDVLAAIRLLKTMNAKGKRKLPEDAPMSFVSPKWEPFVRTPDGLDRHYVPLRKYRSRSRQTSAPIWRSDPHSWRKGSMRSMVSSRPAPWTASR